MPPDDVATELRRVLCRWRELPLDRAEAVAPPVRALAQALADATASAHGRPPVALPDLGPAVLADQLTVTVYDAEQAGAATDLAVRLAELRRAIG